MSLERQAQLGGMMSQGKPATQARPIRWLHLSDFHFTSSEGWDRRRTLEALLEFLRDRKAAGWSPDFVFATGDIANTGQLKEYDQAHLFFRKLGEVLELDLPRQLFLIPGNHDVNRGAIGPVDDFILDGLLKEYGTEQQERISKLLNDATMMKALGRRLSEYYAFTERLLGPARRVQEDKPWRVDFVDVAGVEVAVLQLNSAWASGRTEEKGRLLVGRHQLDDALAEASSAQVRIVLVHHPADYLADGDAGAFRDRLKARGGAHFVLRGHLHETSVELSVNPDGGLIELAAGAVYQGTKWPKRFLIGEADLAAGRAAVEYFVYSERGAGFWTADTLSYEKSKDGRHAFVLPSELRLGGVEKSTDPATVLERQRTVAARYRDAVVAVYGQMRFIGIPAAAGGSRRDVEVQELFVPLRLSLAGQRADKSSGLATADLLDRLTPGRANPGRFVVLGEPGAGKTTLCKYAAVFFGGDRGPRADGEQGGRARRPAPTGGSEPVAAEVSEPIPLFLLFREYVRHCREAGDCGLLDFLVEEARKHLSVGSVDADWLDAVLSAGDAVLLLDGLDEVGGAAERDKMRDRVLGFCSQYPKLPVLLTSRFAGYAEAPLPQTFARLELKPFEDEDLRTFVRAWYAVQEKNDPVARERGIADLWAAMKEEPRVRALAGNPLLATLIALVHRSEAKLPGERAKLYELVVRTLLETWPNQSGRKFAEIDEGLQRSFLETFALQQQEKRSRPDAEVNFRQEELVEALSAIVGQREPGAATVQVRRKVERWVAYLAAGTGILVEQQAGVFTFLHLSLLEYLAAAALDQQEEALEDRIAGLLDNAVWREILLLAVGRHATDLPFLDRLYARLSEVNAWDFLLLCLREEAAFDALKRGAILSEVGKGLLAKLPHEWELNQAVVQTIERFSLRHGDEVRSWRLGQLAEANGEALRAVVVLSFGQQEELQQVLDSRRDQATAAAELLEFWPGSHVGEWVAKMATGELIGRSLKTLPIELAIVRALAALESKEASGCLLTAAAICQLSANVGFGVLAREAAKDWAGMERPNWAGGLPLRVIVRPLNKVLEVLPSSFRHCEQVKVGWNIGCTRLFSRILGRHFVREFACEFGQDVAREFARELTSIFGLGHFKIIFRAAAEDFTRYFDRELGATFAREVAFDFSVILTRESVQQFAISVAERPYRSAMKPDEIAEGADRRSWAIFMSDPLADALAERAHERSMFRRAAETWIALVTTAQRSREEAEAYLGHRQQNFSLLYLWPALDAKLAAEPDPARLALYLQLGWTQSTTTHEWPATERWIALMKAGPPAHWWPRAHWHLCWLLHDTAGNPGHQQGFNAALTEGLRDPDPDHLRVAETLKELIGFF